MTDWAIFTGDIVNSSKMSSDDLSLVFKDLKSAADVVSGWQGASARFTRFRGDGWQMLVAPRLVFRAALVVRAAVRQSDRQADTRIGIGFGTTDLAGDDLSGAGGSAFVGAGSALDMMSRRDRMRARNASGPLRVALPLADQIVGGWTDRQAEVALHLLDPGQQTHMDVAGILGVTRQTVQRHADSSGIAALLLVCDELESQTYDS